MVQTDGSYFEPKIRERGPRRWTHPHPFPEEDTEEDARTLATFDNLIAVIYVITVIVFGYSVFKSYCSIYNFRFEYI